MFTQCAYAFSEERKGNAMRFNSRYAILTLGVIVGPGLSAGTAEAATASSTFAVTSTVQATCTVTSGTNLAFGIYTGTQATATTTVSVACTNTTAYQVGLNAGTATGATVATRKMTGPSSAVLSYSLFRDASRTQNWGNTAGTDTVSGTGDGTTQAITVYGAVPAGQFVAPGSYADTIVVTVTY